MTVKVPEKILIMRWFIAFSVMILAVTTALLLTKVLLPVFDPSVFTLFYAAVAVSAWYGGMRLGVLAIALSVTTALYFLIDPVYSFDFLSFKVLVRLTTFSLVSFLITALSSELRTARRKAETSLKLLQNSEMRFGQLAESNIIGVIVTDINNGFIIEANDAFLNTIGYTREDFSANKINWREITPPEYLLLSERSVEEVRTTGRCKPFEKEYIRKDGDRIPVLLGSVMLGDTQETVIAFVVDLSQQQAALRDVYDELRLRKQAEAALQQANQRNTRTLENMSDAFITLDRDWRIIYQNAEAERINGKPRTEIIGKSHWEEWSASVGTNVEHQYRRAMAEQIPVHFEHHYYLPPKYDLWLEIHAYPSEDGLDIFFRDISERKQVERTLREKEERLKLANERFELAASAVNCLIYDWNIEQDSVERTEGLTRILGYSLAEAEATGNWWFELVHPEDLPSVQEAILALGNSDRYAAEYRIRNKNNQYIYVLDQGILVQQDADGNPVRLVGSTTDISKRKQAEAAIQASEERLRSFVKANIVGILFGDVNGSITEANDEFLRIVGYTQEDIQAGRLSWTDITPSEYQYLDELAIAEATAKGTCTPYEKEFIRKDGSSVPVVVGYSLLGESRHKSVAFILDISDLKQVKKALSQSQEQFQAFMDNIPAAAWITNAEGRVLYLSPTYFSTFNVPTNKAINKNIVDLYPVQIAQPLLDNIRIVAERNQVVQTIESAPRTDGTLGEFLVYKFPIADASSQCLVGGVAIDITERERALRERQLAEQALQERSERLKLLLETTSDLLSTERPLDLMNSLFSKLSAQMDLHCYFHYLIDTHENKQKLRLVAWNGITDDVFQAIEYVEFNQGICGLVVQERRQIVVNNVRHSTHPHAHTLHALGITAYAGQPLIVQGKLLGVLSFASRTRTHFTSGEIALLQATSDQVAVALERAQLMASLQRRKEELIQANRIKDEFLAVLSHELRTPLNPILGWSKLLQTKKYDEATTTRALETIERNAKLQTQLIEDLLDVSRILQGKLSLNIAPVNLETAIAAAIETVHLAAEAKSINLQFTILDFGVSAQSFPAGRYANDKAQEPSNDFGLDNSQINLDSIDFNKQLNNLKCQTSNSKFLVRGDSGRLQQVIWNLVSNAIKFTPQGGQVEISLESVGSQVQLRVSDTGKGISPDFLPFVFDYFRQADGATTRKFGGLGLGLAIVRHIVELHGGTVKAESLGEEQGATFTVMLPLNQVDLNSHQIASLPDDLPDFNGLKVLLVDDERDTRELIAFILEQSGAVVIQAACAMEALQVMPQFQPNLLLSDIGMPEVDGYMLIRKIRAMSPEQGGEIPAIALTAYAGEVDYQQAIAAGFGQHITKPVEPAKLLRAIANLVYSYSNC
ncbi:MAG: PAS domain S-box protein [Nostoc sp. DedQUE12b]|uniref:PAS domain S-box protein n=1 Tax=Nostoc sp. DedQUE12b TaxID=3075398 RepID=UPI002AD403C5|nr:PAS domain S-box protein [Nostoc sp. DedQUE12b]MDZ8089657.1 PAS domain S-box protein [Nostoc sp. DedQUE12b]